MENEEFNLDKELMDIRVKNIQLERIRRQELEEKLRHYKLVKRAQIGIAVGLATVITLGSMAAAYWRKHRGLNPTPHPVVTEEDGKIELSRSYVIKYGDTLTSISRQTGIPISKIAEDNHIDNPNKIGMNHHLMLNYSIDPADLEYYTESVDLNGKSLPQIAADYDTTVNTLININGESLTEETDTILVPNFISPSELEEAKHSQKR